jgi:hypothetical protein
MGNLIARWATLLALFTSFNSANAQITPQLDDCEFIRQGLAHLSSSGGEFVIPTGTYTCFSPIIMDRDHLRLRGEGSVLLRLGDNVNTPLLIMGQIQTPPVPVREVQVSNLLIDGNRLKQENECWAGKCDSGGTSNIRNNGITVRGVIDGKIDHVAIRSPRSGGVVTEKGCVHLLIDDLSVTDSAFDGFAGYETTGSILSNMTFSHNQSAGISIDLRFSGNTIRDTHILQNSDVGIFMRESNGNLFDHLTIEDSGNHGIFLAYDNNISTCANGNEFKDLTILRSKGAGFRLNNECNGNHLTGTTRFIGNRDGCISEGTSTPLKIDGQMTCEN